MGWFIVEDVLTVIALISLPTIVTFLKGSQISFQETIFSIVIVVIKFFLLAAIMFTLGRKIVAYLLFKIARTKSHELFTLSVLALIFLIATASAAIFGISIALGAFIAGMVIGQTDVRHQAAAYSSPMKDAFAVIFFLSVGMLFNPHAIVEHFSLFISVLAVILLVKPLAAFLIVLLLRYPFGIALTISIALAQIGEFSFIFAEEAIKFDVLSNEGYDIIVACSLISIAINPLLFKIIDYFSSLEKKGGTEEHGIGTKISLSPLKALVIGYGFIGQSAAHSLEEIGFMPVVIDRNVDTIAKLLEQNQEAVYGDASQPNILEMTHIKTATLLVITIPDLAITLNIIHAARHFNPDIPIVARVKYQAEKQQVSDLGVNVICCDEDEVSKALNNYLFRFAKDFFLGKKK